jgi:hypothetical protein
LCHIWFENVLTSYSDHRCPTTTTTTTNEQIQLNYATYKYYYEQFTRWAQEEMGEFELSSQAVWRRIWKEHFPHIVIRTRQPQPQKAVD